MRGRSLANAALAGASGLLVGYTVGFLLPFSLAIALGNNPVHDDVFAIVVPASMVICALIGGCIVGRWAWKESRRAWVIAFEAIASIIVLHTVYKLLLP